MSRSSRRDLGIGATLAVMLAAGLVIPRWAQTLLLMGAVMLLVSACVVSVVPSAALALPSSAVCMP